MAARLPITNGFYVSAVLPISHQRCSNCYPSIPTKPALSDEQLLFTPGLSQLASSGVVLDANRGSHEKNGVPYFVNGTNLYRLDRTVERQGGVNVTIYSLVNLGFVEGSGRVSMADNGAQLMVLVPGGAGYIYNENAGTPFEVITDPDFLANGNPQIVVYVDGYFLVTTDSKKFIISALNDGLSYDALDFATAESDPDIIVAPIVLNNQVYITGSKTTEGFQNLPSIGRTPFVRNNVIKDKGCKAPFSLVKSNSSFFMVGAGEDESPAIWQFINNSFRKKSTEAIEQLLATYTEDQIANIYATAYSDGGAYFVTFTLPDTTLCFDVITERWHERNSTIDDVESPWRVSSIVSAYGMILAGDTQDGRVGQLSLNFVKEYDNNIVRLFTTQPFTDQGDEVVPKMLEMTTESGSGNVDVPDPVMSMAASRNGKTFSNERTRKMGKKGEYGRRTVWYKNGSYPRLVVFLFRMSEPVKSAFIKLEYE